jgi:ubiquinol-cytochrome c reductase cytochrome b subunit
VIGRIARWVDDRLGLSRFARTTLDKVFPDHWSFMLGEVALYCFVVLVLTGVFLTFFFEPSTKEVVYHGAYKPLDGVSMSEAYRSTVRLSFDVRAGLVMRQIHHWAALLFTAAVVTHLARVFFTGAFRRPREINWIIGVTLLLLVIGNGFTGYSMPDDLLSGTGLRIMYSIVLSIPLGGTWLAFLFFGGEFPADAIIKRLFVIHILLVPAAIALLLSAHLAILWRQKHTQFAGPAGDHVKTRTTKPAELVLKTEKNVVGSYLWPTYAAKSVGLFAMVFAVLAALGGLAQINPIWLYGPFRPAVVSTAAQPDWYVGWLEGALRIFPPWEIRVWHHTVANVFFPGVLLPGITFALLYAWPFLEQRVTRDVAVHHLLDRPRDRPVRTALGVATLSFYVVLMVAGAQDILAQKINVNITVVTHTLQALVLVLPVLAAAASYKLCKDLQGEDALAVRKRQAVAGGALPPPAAAVTAAGRRAGPPGDRAEGGRTAQAAAGALVAGLAWLFGRRRR